MLKSPNRQTNCKEDHENKIIIEKWMKRNSNNKVVIGQNIEKINNSVKKPKNTSTYDIKISESKKVVIPIEITENKLNKLKGIKRGHSFPTDNGECSASKAKIFKPSSPHKSTLVSTFRTNISTNTTPKLPNKTKPTIEIIPTKAKSEISPKILPKSKISPNNSIPIIEVIKTTSNVIDNEVNNFSSQIVKCTTAKSTSAKKVNQIVKNIVSPVKKCNVADVSPLKGNSIVKQVPPPIIKCNVVKTSKMKVDIKTSENNIGVPSNGANNLLKRKEEDKKINEDVYTSLLENYRYLVIPKGWSVNEFTNEAKNRYIVFFHNQVVEEKGVLISVINKSLIVDKGGKMNFSAHGLPVDIKGTILPKTLDNTKKLLSILHIFDKMQVCQGLGSDLNPVQNGVIFKDCCRYWRHENCKVILIKAVRCSECTEARNVLKRSESELEADTIIVKPEIEFVDVKTEGIFDISE